MELLFVTVIAAGIGAIVRYALPQRGTYGLFLLPSLSAAVTSGAWVVLVWLGLKFDGTWIWVVSLVAGGAAALIAGFVLPRRRVDADARMLESLSRG